MRPSSQNRLLALLPADDLHRLQPDLEQVAWPRGFVFAEPDVPHDHVYFPTDGLASVIAVTPGKRRLEVGIYGRDGVGPPSIALGINRTPHQHFVQAEGEAWRIESGKLAAAMERMPALRAMIMRYVHVFMIQTGYTALSNGSGVIGERLARWLLMCRDRLHGDDFTITHEFLGIMLGVRRAGVTHAIHKLEGFGIIRATRGRIKIIDRARLEEMAGDSYGVPEAEYRRLIGPMA